MEQIFLNEDTFTFAGASKDETRLRRRAAVEALEEAWRQVDRDAGLPPIQGRIANRARHLEQGLFLVSYEMSSTVYRKILSWAVYCIKSGRAERQFGGVEGSSDKDKNQTLLNGLYKYWEYKEERRGEGRNPSSLSASISSGLLGVGVDNRIPSSSQGPGPSTSTSLTRDRNSQNAPTPTCRPIRVPSPSPPNQDIAWHVPNVVPPGLVVSRSSSSTQNRSKSPSTGAAQITLSSGVVVSGLRPPTPPKQGARNDNAVKPNANAIPVLTGKRNPTIPLPPSRNPVSTASSSQTTFQGPVVAAPPKSSDSVVPPLPIPPPPSRTPVSMASSLQTTFQGPVVAAPPKPSDSVVPPLPIATQKQSTANIGIPRDGKTPGNAPGNHPSQLPPPIQPRTIVNPPRLVIPTTSPQQAIIRDPQISILKSSQPQPTARHQCVPVPSPQRAPVPVPSPQRAPVPVPSPQRTPVPVPLPQCAPVPVISPQRASSSGPRPATANASMSILKVAASTAVTSTNANSTPPISTRTIGALVKSGLISLDANNGQTPPVTNLATPVPVMFRLSDGRLCTLISATTKPTPEGLPRFQAASGNIIPQTPPIAAVSTTTQSTNLTSTMSHILASKFNENRATQVLVINPSSNPLSTGERVAPNILSQRQSSSGRTRTNVNILPTGGISKPSTSAAAKKTYSTLFFENAKKKTTVPLAANEPKTVESVSPHNIPQSTSSAPTLTAPVTSGAAAELHYSSGRISGSIPVITTPTPPKTVTLPTAEAAALTPTTVPVPTPVMTTPTRNVPVPTPVMTTPTRNVPVPPPVTTTPTRNVPVPPPVTTTPTRNVPVPPPVTTTPTSVAVPTTGPILRYPASTATGYSASLPNQVGRTGGSSLVPVPPKRMPSYQASNPISLPLYDCEQTGGRACSMSHTENSSLVSDSTIPKVVVPEPISTPIPLPVPIPASNLSNNVATNQEAAYQTRKRPIPNQMLSPSTLQSIVNVISRKQAQQLNQDIPTKPASIIAEKNLNNTMQNQMTAIALTTMVDRSSSQQVPNSKKVSPPKIAKVNNAAASATGTNIPVDPFCSAVADSCSTSEEDDEFLPIIVRTESLAQERTNNGMQSQDEDMDVEVGTTEEAGVEQPIINQSSTVELGAVASVANLPVLTTPVVVQNSDGGVLPPEAVANVPIENEPGNGPVIPVSAPVVGPEQVNGPAVEDEEYSDISSPNPEGEGGDGSGPQPNDGDDSSDNSDNDSDSIDDEVPSNGAVRDWRFLPLEEMVKYLYDHEGPEFKKDVTFLVGNDKEPIHAHKCYLFPNSSVLENLVYDGVTPPCQHMTKELLDVDPQAFRVLLKAIYYRAWQDNPTWSLDTKFKILYAANKFALLDSGSHVRASIRSDLNPDTATKILDQAVTLGDNRLKDFAMQIINVHARRILLGETLRELSLDSLCVVLESDGLEVEEIVVFRAATIWARTRIEERDNIINRDAKVEGTVLRAELGRALTLIRLPIMDKDSYAKEVLGDKTNLFPEADLTPVTMYFLLSGGNPAPYSTIPRAGTRRELIDPANNANKATDDESSSSSGTGGSWRGRGGRGGGRGGSDGSRGGSVSGSAGGEGSNSLPQQPPAGQRGLNQNQEHIPSRRRQLDQGEDNVGESADEPSAKRLKTEQRSESGSSQSRASDNLQDTNMNIDPNADETVGVVESDFGPLLENLNSPQKKIVIIVDDQNASTSAGFLPINLPPENQTTPKKQKVKVPLLTPDEDAYVRQQLGKSKEGWPHSRTLTNFYNALSSPEYANEEHIEEAEVVIENKNLFLVLLPNLREFHVKYLSHCKTVAHFKKYLSDLDIQKTILFFSKAYGNLDTFWDSGVNITLTVNGITVLKMGHTTGTLVISRINSAVNSLLAGLKLGSGIDGPVDSLEDLKHLHLDEVKIKSLDIIPISCLTSVTLRKVRGIKERTNFIKSCNKTLEEFSCDDMGTETLDFGRDIGLLEDGPPTSKLRRIYLGKAKLECSVPHQTLTHSPLEELYLDNCTLSPTFIAAIPKIFPTLKKAKIYGNNIMSKVVSQLLEISTLEWLGVWMMGFPSFGKKSKSKSKNKGTGNVSSTNTQLPADVTKVMAVLTEAGLGDNRSWLTQHAKTFVLRKEDVKDEAGAIVGRKWVGSKYMKKEAFLEFTRFDFDHSGWGHFYKDFDTFYKING